MYGVVVCPRCRRAKGVRLGQKAARCQCGHVIDLSVAKVYGRTDSPSEIPKLVALQSARLLGGLKEYEKAVAAPKRPGGVHGRVADVAAEASGRDQKVRAAAAELTRELGSFTAKDFSTVLEALGLPASDSRLKDLLAENFVYEPEPGRYRTV